MNYISSIMLTALLYSHFVSAWLPRLLFRMPVISVLQSNYESQVSVINILDCELPQLLSTFILFRIVSIARKYSLLAPSSGFKSIWTVNLESKACFHAVSTARNKTKNFAMGLTHKILLSILLQQVRDSIHLRFQSRMTEVLYLIS